MTQEATQAGARAPTLVRVLARELAEAGRSEAVRAAWRAFAWTRAAILVVAVLAALYGGAAVDQAAPRFDLPALTAPLGGFGDMLVSPLARWDAVWYLKIAVEGYGAAGSPEHAFFPLYPALARWLATFGGGGAGATQLAAYAVSLAAFFAALVLLHRLTELELGRAAAWPTLLLLAVFPASLYFGAPYSESLFLLCSVGAFYAARNDRWALAGLAAAAASGTRSAGVLLALPLLFLYLYGPRPAPPTAHVRRGTGAFARVLPRYAPRPDALWLALAPAGLVAFATFLALAYGDPLSFSHVQELWTRTFAGPLVGAWDGAVAAFEGARQLLSGAREPVYFDAAAGDPFRVGAHNVVLFATLCFALAGAIGVLRRLPFAYGLYVVVALMLPLSFPVAAQPLMSLPRFVVVLFPIFMWLGAACARRGLTERVAVAFAIGLGLFVTQFATWEWVA